MSKMTENEETKEESFDISDSKWAAIGTAALTIFFIWLTKTDIFYGHSNIFSKAFFYWKQHWVYMYDWYKNVLPWACFAVAGLTFQLNDDDKDIAQGAYAIVIFGYLIIPILFG